jgi:hypothetical protein
MDNYVEELKNLQKVVADLEKSQTNIVKLIATKLHQLETSIQTGAWYPIETATKDIENKFRV